MRYKYGTKTGFGKGKERLLRPPISDDEFSYGKLKSEIPPCALVRLIDGLLQIDPDDRYNAFRALVNLQETHRLGYFWSLNSTIEPDSQPTTISSFVSDTTLSESSFPSITNTIVADKTSDPPEYSEINHEHSP